MTTTITPGTHHLDPLPDLPGKVHGIKQVGEVWAVQCDDCSVVEAGTVPVIVCGSITFNNRLRGTDDMYLRLCSDCWEARGWKNTVTSGWTLA